VFGRGKRISYGHDTGPLLYTTIYSILAGPSLSGEELLNHGTLKLFRICFIFLVFSSSLFFTYFNKYVHTFEKKYVNMLLDVHK
jgi:hypothetical protein